MKNKAIYLSHWSALIEYTVGHLGKHFDDYIRERFAPEIANAKKTTHYVTFQEKYRGRRRGVFVHLCRTALPKNATRRRKGQPIVCPEYAFLQVALKLSIHHLILLGLILCATPKGRKPLTTRAKLEAFTEAAEYHAGRDRARRAIQYIRDGCRSPMEALTYMKLCLPNRLGGAGLSGAEFDYRIDLEAEEAATIDVQTHVRADLAFPKHKVIVEYDSSMYHSEEEEQIRDVVRADIIRSKDNTVIPVHKMDLYDLNNHYTLLQDLIGTMDLKLRIRARNFALGFEQIRSLLPRWHSQSWEPSTQAIHRKIRYLISQRERGELLPKPRRRDKVLRRALEIIDFYDQMKVPMNRQHGYCESIDFNVIWAA